MLLHISIGLLFIILSPGYCQEWKPEYFLPPPQNNDGIINFTSYTSGNQKISVREEIPWPFKLAIINYDGDKIPKIGKFDFGSNDLLGASVNKDEKDHKWYIIIEKRQDYENEKQRFYSFDVNIGDQTQSIIINLQNIFDVPPSITYDGPCTAEELKSNFPANCTFHVYDEDGMDGNKITFKIEGQYKENELFNLKEVGDISSYQKDYNLFIIKELHYEDRTSYNFKIFVYDIANNAGNMTAILEVIDMPNMNPVWVKPFITAAYDEKTEKEFSVRAIDGDTGINKTIWYRLEFNDKEDYSDLMRIDKTEGILHVKKIDRDKLKKEIFSFKVCAYKFDNETWAVCDSPAIIIQDINDNYPEITINPDNLNFNENTFLTLQFDEFFVEDIDLGTHATYNVTLSQSDSNEIIYSEAFDMIPNAGYQKSNFRITVQNASLLDYENSDWRSFELKIISQEIDMKEHKREKYLKIDLINWNDELPIFDKESYQFNVLETIGNNSIIGTVNATDRDIDDRVEYDIVGQAEGLIIFKNNGSIKTTLNRTFDHERQTIVVIQIRANDTLIALPTDKIHSTYTQVIINVIDVNDKTPEIRMPRKTPNITENSSGGTLVTDQIIATDPDTTAELVFEIDWKNSYATKSGQEADKATYENCFYIEPKIETRNKVYGLLKANPDFTKSQDIDYEKYDTIYLTIKVTDTKQEVGEGSTEGILTVRIDDVNDNRPIFVYDTLDEERSVSEEAENDRIIGTIRAIDIDGPPFNIFNFTITPKLNQLPITPTDLIYIHNETGIIRVKDGNKIDCDLPKREYLYYTITLNDGVPPNTQGNIEIRIIDINNKKPQIEKFPNPVKIKEKSKDGTFIGKISATDLDRDYPHNTTQYSIDFKLFPNLKNFFDIDTISGEIKVKLLGDSVLDRDLGEPMHEIHCNVEDNYMGNGVTNTNKTSLTVILIDINDHAPELPDPKQFKPKIRENSKKDDFVIDTGIDRPDIDEPNTPNSWVSYRILSIQPAGDNPSNVLENYKNLFRIESPDKDKGYIYVNQDLKGYYGDWNIEIEGYDHGDEGPDKIQMNNITTYTFTIIPYNFHNPEIIYPSELTDKMIRLSYRGQQTGIPLLLAEGEQLRSFEAYDPDGGDSGNVTFHISNYDPTSSDADYFQIYKESRTKSRLQITKPIQPRRYHLNLVAEDEAKSEDGGKKKSKEIQNLIITFIDMNSEPYFEKNEFNTNFTEKDKGLLEESIIPKAIDPKNEGIQNDNEKTKIFYFIDNKYNLDDSKLFTLDKNTRILKLLLPLNRAKQSNHRIRIIATNLIDGPKGSQDESFLLYVNIKVQGPPIFDEKSYGAGITTSDYTSKVILIIHASSSNNIISYEKNDIWTNGENIDTIKQKIFNLENNTGKLILNEPPTNQMKGYFQFNVTAIDDMKRTDQTNIKIYIVTESNRIEFIFYNDYNYIGNNTEFIKNTLKNIYGYDMCNIDDIIKGKPKNNNNENDGKKSNDDGGDEEEGITTVRVHFIRNNEAVDASEFKSKSSDIKILDGLKRKLNEKSLYLNDISQLKTDDTTKQVENLQTIVLGILTGILFCLCIALGIAYIIRIRLINRQLKAFTIEKMTTTKTTTQPTTTISDNFYDNNSKNINIIKNHLPMHDEQMISYNEFTDKNFGNKSMEKMNPISNFNNSNHNNNDNDIDIMRNAITVGDGGSGDAAAVDPDSQSAYSDESEELAGIQNDLIFMTEDYMNGINPRIFCIAGNKNKDGTEA